MRTFDLWPLDLVESNIHGLHSLQEKGCENFLAKKSLNVPNVKMFSFFFFQCFWLVYAFWRRMVACTFHIEWFPWHLEPQQPQWPQWPPQPQRPQWPQQPHIIKTLTEHDVAINLATKWPTLVSQCGMNQQKSTILWIFCHICCCRLWRPWMLLSTKSKGHKSNIRIS